MQTLGLLTAWPGIKHQKLPKPSGCIFFFIVKHFRNQTGSFSHVMACGKDKLTSDDFRTAAGKLMSIVFPNSIACTQ